MHPFDAAASFLSTNTPAEGSFDPRQQEQEALARAASSPSSSPSRRTRAAGGECRDAHCCSVRGFVCPGHVKAPSHVPAFQQRSERQQTTPAAVHVEHEPISKRSRRAALPSVAATTSSVDQPIATTTALGLERFAREVSLDAVFRRVRLGGPDDPEIAYYTTVTIAGHVFRGLLYDAGPHSGSSSTATASDTDGSGEVGSSLSTAGGSCLDLTLGL